MHDEHGLILTETELAEILALCRAMSEAKICPTCGNEMVLAAALEIDPDECVICWQRRHRLFRGGHKMLGYLHSNNLAKSEKSEPSENE